jgi:pyruvate/2-oxoglutarate dehydrogenase complex dihydrolipoamide dehydrogenase (E3) component
VSHPDPTVLPAAGDAAVQTEYRRLVFPAGHRNPQPVKRYNLVVIGAGPAGLVTSMAAASLGAQVALVERHAMGGDCLNFGCVPSKTLLAAAAAGLPFATAMERVRSVRASIARHDSVERFTAAGVDVYLGEARFHGPHLIKVGEASLHTRKSVIATGARPALPPITGLETSVPLTNESVFEPGPQPLRLAILGAGAAGCELAQAFARLGTRVELFEVAPQILPREDPQAAALVAGALAREGVVLHTGSQVHSVGATPEGIELAIAGGVRVVVDRVLVTAGRHRNVEGLGLDKAGVRLDERGAIAVDHRLRTAHPDIYAAGDVCSQYQFTHAADAHARIVVRNALFRGRARADRLVVPRCVYTKPEVAHVGPTRCQLDERGVPYDRYRVDWAELDRGMTDDAADGYAEILASRGSGQILGATLVGRDAGEQLAPILLLMGRGRGLESVGSLVLPYPTRSEYLRRLADAHARKRLTPRVARVLGWWLRHSR